MDAVGIVPRSIYALRPEVKNSGHFITDFQILYPAGSVLVIHNYYEKRQKHINLYGKSPALEAIEISPSRRLVAIILNSERGQIIVYDLQTLKKRRTLNLPPDSATNRFETVSFTHDDLYILAITGEPDWSLLLFNWEKGKLTSTSKGMLNSNPSTIIKICCSPTENTEICLIGQGLFKLLSRMETVWRQYGFQKADMLNITSGVWLSSNAILCGTIEGKLLLIENGDLKGIYNAFTVNNISLKDTDESNLSESSSSLLFKTQSDSQQNEDLAVRAITVFPKGFAYSCRSGYVHFFEKEAPNKYRKRNVFRIPPTDLLHLSESELNTVTHLSINISQDKMLACTNRAQLYTTRLWGPDIKVAPELYFKILGEPLHHGTINGLAMCLWKPFFATSGRYDRTIRVWDYETETVQIVKNFTDEIRCLDLHPTGNFMAIGFRDKLDFSVLLTNDIVAYRSLPVVECDICRFSWYGQYLAVVYRTVIDVYDTIMLKIVFSLKSHIGKINAMHWLTEDKKMVSCSSSGEIFIWEMTEGTIVEEIRTADSFVDIVVSADNTRYYAVDSNGVLQVFVKHNQEPSMLVAIEQSPMEKILLSRANLMMFVAANQTDILSMKMPLTSPPEYSEFIFHNAKIEQMKLSYNDQTLVSVTEGGTTIIWKLNVPEGKTVPIEKKVFHTTEILINKPELEKKIQTIQNLSQKLQDLELDQLKDVRKTESDYIKTLSTINDNYTQNIHDLREKIERTEADQDTALRAIQVDIAELREKQTKEKEDLVENYSKKLLVEYEKVRALETLKEDTIKNFEDMVAELEESKERETKELIGMYEEKLQQVNCLLEETYEENQRNITEHETLKQQIEEDTDRELVETIAKYEGQLKEERERNAILKDETLIMRKKHAEVQKEKNNFRERLEFLQGEMSKSQTTILSLEKDVADLKSEILERDTTAEEKDEKIFQLKKQIQELDKFKFVLEYKIKELRKEIDPKSREIREKNEQIADMEIEQENLKKINSSLELQLTELKEKVNGTEKEINEYEKKYRGGKIALRQIRFDIYFLYQNLNDFKKLKDGIRVLNTKYLACEVVPAKEQLGESDLERDLLIEREFLEKTVKALKSTLLKNLGRKYDKTKVVKDNTVLLEELNSARKSLTDAVTTVRGLENLIGFKPQKVIVPSEAFRKLQNALKKQKKMKQAYQNVINEAARETTDLETKMDRMQEKFTSLLQSEM